MAHKRRFSFCYCREHPLTKPDSGKLVLSAVLLILAIGIQVAVSDFFGLPVRISRDVGSTVCVLVAIFVAFSVPRGYPCFADRRYRGFDRAARWLLPLLFIIFLLAHVMDDAGSGKGYFLLEGFGIAFGLGSAAYLAIHWFRRGTSQDTRKKPNSLAGR